MSEVIVYWLAKEYHVCTTPLDIGPAVVCKSVGQWYKRMDELFTSDWWKRV